MEKKLDVEQAEQVLRAEYYGAVRSYAEDLIARVKSGEIKDESELSDATHEAIDGSEWIIYTHKAAKVCLCSDNDNAYFDETGAEDWMSVRSSAEIFTRLAFYAMRADVQSLLGDAQAFFDKRAGEVES